MIMNKRILVMLAVMSLTASAVMHAQTSGSGFAPEGVSIDKKVVETGPNQYRIDLEAYATGKKTKIETVTKAMDLVFVVDVSGSMDDRFYSYRFVARSSASYSTAAIYGIGHFGTRSSEFYYLYNGEYYNVKTMNEGDLVFAPSYYLYFTAEDGRHYLYGNGIQSTKPSGVGNSGLTNGAYVDIFMGVLYTREQVLNTTKMDAMQAAASSFVSQVQASAEENGVDHRIGIVKFAGSKRTTVGNTSGYSQIVNMLSNDYSTVLANISRLSSGGATSADYGMQLAQEVLKGARTDSYKSVIMITDGLPNHDSDFDPTVATSTVSAAKALKDAGTIVYTIYIGDEDDINEPADPGLVDNGGANIDDSERMWNYMNAVSSNYPKATGYKGGSLGARGTGDYYTMVTSTDDLNFVFNDITEEIIESGAIVELTKDAATVVDIVSDCFMLPEGAGKSDIDLSVAPCSRILYDGTENITGYEFGSAIPVPGTGFPDVAASIDGNKVTVGGFDFSSNYVGEGPDRSPHGYKLMISFPIVINPANPGGASVATNTAESGIYYDSDDDGNPEQIAGFSIPEVKIPNLVIIKKGLKKGESAVFNVYRLESEGVRNATPMVLVATQGDGDYAVAKAKIQVPGRYEVEETGWSWAYDVELQSTYGKDDSDSITEAQWHAVGYGPAAERYVARIPFDFGTETGGRSIIRNVNDFTEEEGDGYKGTLFVFTNIEKAYTPSHDESNYNNVFNESK